MGRKTLRQKKRADEKKVHPTSSHGTHTIGSQVPTAPTYTFSTEPTKKNLPPQPYSPSQPEVAYVTHDLKKTLVLSLSIVLLEALLYFSLHSHILALPFLRY